jgi:Ca2+-binding RTX toxin-like protein
MTSTSHPIRRAALGALAASALAAATLASVGVTPAQAAGNTTVTRSGNVVTVTAAVGTVNDVTVRRSPNGTRLDVTDVAITAGAGCTKTGARSVQCSAAGVTQLNISTGDRNDRVFVNFNNSTRVLAGSGDDVVTSTNGAGTARLNGGDGNDSISGAIFDSLFGQNGNDFLAGGRFLSGGFGNDMLFGLSGNDVLNGNDGQDSLNGGSGTDDLCLNGESLTGCEA